MTKERQKELEARSGVYFKQLVPNMGKCDTVEGEMLRAINKIIYRQFNDGDYFFEGYGCETAGPAHAYLINESPLAKRLNEIFSTTEFNYTQYDDTIYAALETILDYIDSVKGQYTNNELDMLDSDPVFEEEDDSCWDCGEIVDYCSCDEEEY
tara:strand:+ start:160 stop:618 length:459 start_codon:yes stop_codon:yes gene_type:complete